MKFSGQTNFETGRVRELYCEQCLHTQNDYTNNPINYIPCNRCGRRTEVPRLHSVES